MGRDEEERERPMEAIESVVKQCKDLAGKITVANFVRYVGPGIVVFGLLKVSKAEVCKDIVTAFKTDKGESTFLLLLFLVLGALVHTAYRAFLYNKPIIYLKDRTWCKRRDWRNYREVLTIENPEKFPETRGSVRAEMKRAYNADWVWRRLKGHFARDGYDEYDPGMGLWAASIHLLYFTGISLGVFMILEWCESCTRGFLYSAAGIIAFLGGLLADTEYERAETYFYEELRQKKETEVKDFLEKLFGSRAFRIKEADSSVSEAPADTD